MPMLTKKPGEDKNDFMARCMSSEVMKKDYPGNEQRVAVCISRATEDLDYISAADYKMYFENYGSEEELNEDNFYVPQEWEYVSSEEINFEESEILEYDIAEDKPGLWENIRKKKEREGKNYKPAKKGDPDRPDPEAWKKAQSKFKYKDPQSGELYFYERQGVYKKNGTTLVYVGKAAEYQGRKVQLGKPFRTPNGPKKFSVYVKNDKGNVVKVNFGDPNLSIKKHNPERRKSFRARHGCDKNPGPKWKARYWSCQWSW